MRQLFSARGMVGHVLVAMVMGVLAWPATGQERPNFVFILVDDLGWRDLGAYGSPFYETPNVDALAASGVRFTDAYAANPVCSPTRASIMTGMYPTRVGITDYISHGGFNQPGNWPRGTELLPAAYVDRLELEHVTMGDVFQEAGYTTFYAGKWHLGPEGYWPEDQGFEINKGGFHAGTPPSYFSPYNNPRLEDGPEGEYLPDRLSQETAEFIEAHRDEPFLAFLAFYTVHTPLVTTEELEAKYERKAAELDPDQPRFEPIQGADWGPDHGPEDGVRQERVVQDHAVYAGMVEAMDRGVGRVMEALERTGQDENTVVIFMSDNGGLSTSEGQPTANRPLRTGKGWPYEGGIRVPMIIRAPGVAEAGGESATPVTSTDFLPTMLELAGLPLRPGDHLDGVSLAPLLAGEAQDRGAIYWHYPHYSNQGTYPGGAMREGPWKLIENYETGELELYHLERDIAESQNLAEAEPERVEAMHERFRAWLEEQGATMPSERE